MWQEKHLRSHVISASVESGHTIKPHKDRIIAERLIMKYMDVCSTEWQTQVYGTKVSIKPLKSVGCVHHGLGIKYCIYSKKDSALNDRYFNLSHSFLIYFQKQPENKTCSEPRPQLTFWVVQVLSVCVHVISDAICSGAHCLLFRVYNISLGSLILSELPVSSIWLYSPHLRACGKAFPLPSKR